MLIAGVDGGGSKTEAVIVDLDERRIIGRGLSGPSNYHNVGLDIAVANIVDSLAKAAVEAGLDNLYFDSLCISLAGLDTRFDREYVSERLASLGISRILVIEHDAHEALMAGSLGEPGISVIAGTGSIAYGWDGRSRYIAGNHGWLLGDQGSGFWIGFKGLRTAVRMLDGRLEKSVLADLVLKHIGAGDKEELSYIIYNRGFSVDYIASLAPIVAEACSLGDHTACNILYRAGYELAKAVKAVATRTRLRGGYGVYYTGGVFSIGTVKSSFEKHVRELVNGVSVEMIKYRPVVGSLVIAAIRAGVEVNVEDIEGIEILRII